MAFLQDRRTNPIDTGEPIGIVERIPPVKGVRPRRVYFTDPSGVRWRVFDTSYGPPEGIPGEERHFAPPYPPAKGRVFIAENGDRRAFVFHDHNTPDELKRPLLTPVMVSAQFRSAGYPESTLEEETDPRRDYAILPEPTWKPSEHHSLRCPTSSLNRWTAFDAD
ncbi:MAG TPA: hypothetical protein VGM82_13390 [Gemmatimonadaceae bacterium]